MSAAVRLPLRPCSAIYHLIREGEVIYVGQSKDALSRVAYHEHITEADEVAIYPTALAYLDEVEQREIERLSPRLNRAGVKFPYIPRYTEKRIVRAQELAAQEALAREVKAVQSMIAKHSVGNAILMRAEDVSKRLGQSSELTKDDLLRLNLADPTFPRPVQLSPRMLRWVDSEVDAWIAQNLGGAMRREIDTKLERVASHGRPRRLVAA